MTTKTKYAATYLDVVDALEDAALGVTPGESRVKAWELAATIGVRTGSEVRALVHQARVKGWPVCADRNGYWLGDRAEAMAHAASMVERARAILEAVAGMTGQAR